jgi:DNA-directed RNA polymerase subunit RPC12/RpoP
MNGEKTQGYAISEGDTLSERRKIQRKEIQKDLDRAGEMFYSRRTRARLSDSVRRMAGLAPLVSLIPSGLWESRSMGRYCGKCGREVQAVIYAGEAVSPAPVYRCPHCGPNVPVVGSPVVEKENYADAREAVIDQMEARIEDLKNHIGLQRGLIQQLLGQPEKQPTRDDLIEALATARARLEAHDGETAMLREMVSQLRETVAMLDSQNQIALAALRTLTQRAEFRQGPPPADLGPSHDETETPDEASNASVVRSPGE